MRSCERTPEDADALFAKILTLGLRADYESLIERRDFDALKVIKDSRATAEKLLMLEPNYYDAYLAVGVENYLFSLRSAPMRWILQVGGAETDRDKGVAGSAFDRRKRAATCRPTPGCCWPWPRCATRIFPRRAICWQRWRANSLTTGSTRRNWPGSSKPNFGPEPRSK